MSLPMGGHWLRLRKERDKAQATALQAAHEAEQHLERLVAQRTGELWEAKAQAEAALKATMTVVDGQRQFLRTINHEFRNPLAVLDGHLQLLGQEALTGKSERLPRMRAKIRDLQRLLDTALNQDRLETGVWGREFERVDPAALVRDAIARLDANLDTHPIQFQGTDLPATILANPTMFSILLSNLLENAVRYSPDGGPIQVFGQKREGPWLRIQVTDHGVGMTPS
jgi:signal transduction histidine kinase